MAPPGKSGSSKTRKEREDSSDDDDDDSSQPEPISRLEFAHQQVDRDDGTTPPLIFYHWESIKQTLKTRRIQVNQGRLSAQAQFDSYHEDELQQEINNANAEYRAAREQEVRDAAARGKKPQSGKSERAKAAKSAQKDLEARMKRLEEFKVNRTFYRNRQLEHDHFSWAQRRLEDFLFYQDSSRRWKRWRAIDPTERSAWQAERRAMRVPYQLLSGPRGEDDYVDWLHSLLDYFDERGIGDPMYKEGLNDQWGNRKEERAVPEVGRLVAHSTYGKDRGIVNSPHLIQTVVGCQPIP
jgi:hypothetical protein